MVHLGGAVVLLLLSLISSTEPMEKCPENADLSFLENLTPAPGKSIDTSAGSLEPLYNFARLFIEAVQPNNFPLGKYHPVSYCGGQKWKVCLFNILILIKCELYSCWCFCSGLTFMFLEYHCRFKLCTQL